MLKNIGNFFAEKVSKILPDSFVFAILLTFVTLLLAKFFAGAETQEIFSAWIKGVFDKDIIFFAFLMIMVLTFGFSIGVSKPFFMFFNWLVKVISKPWQVYFFLVILSILFMLVNWGLAPVMAILAVEICKRVKGVDYRVAIASFYSGLLVWHGGLSSSAALMMATEETAQTFIEKGIITNIIPVSETLLVPTNFALIAAVLIALPILVLLLRPSQVDEAWDPAIQYEKTFGPVQDQEPEAATAPKTKQSPAEWLNNSPIVSIFLFLMAMIGFLGIMKVKGFNLGALTFLMLAFGILFHWRPINYVNTMKQAIMGSSDIVLLFPLFGGIMGLFIDTGLAQLFADALLKLATQETLPWFSFVISSIVNLFIPSGGGEWLVLGPPLLKAANIAGADVGKTIIGFAYGDALTNLINPFWTLTFLPIMGQLMTIRPRDFMGYTVFICLIFFVIESAIILFI